MTFKNSNNHSGAPSSDKNANRTEAIGTGSINSLLWTFSVPAIVGMLANASYVIINRIFIGHAVGGIAIAAITLTFPIFIIFMALVMLIGVGATTLISIRLGQQKVGEAEAIMGNALSLLLLVPTVCCVCMYFYIEPLLIIIGANESTLPYSTDYLKVLMPSMILMSVSMGMNNIIRAEGNPVTAMLTQLFGGIVNIFFNYIFVMRLGWGVQGAALGSAMGQVFAVVWVMSYFFRPNHSYLKIRFRNLFIKINHVRGIVAIGFAPFIMQITTSIQQFILNRSLVVYGGDVALAAFGIVGTLAQLLVMPIVGLSQGAQPIIGYNYGARQYYRVRETLKKAVIYSTVLSVISWGAIRLFNGQMVGIFISNEPETTVMATHALLTFFAVMFIVGFQVVCSSYFQAIGKPLQATILLLTRQVLFLIPLLLILPRYIGLEGVWISPPISDVAATLLTAVCIVWELWKSGMLYPENSKNNVGTLGKP
ncbi:MAG: MATE family efflux transporter [Syntrophomonadaceae bacterium]|jgi:putative MATE family efflux protein|nr:MATE family efflux transporter [Syntrophomonadaceae bacterium]